MRAIKHSGGKRSIWTYYVVSVAIVLAAFAALTWYSGDRFRAFFVQHLETVLEERARIIAQRLTDSLNPGIDHARTCQTGQSVTNIRLTVVDALGVVQCDSLVDAATMDNHGDRPEIVAALQGQVGSSTRYSTTLSAALLYVAVPASSTKSPSYVVRAAIALENIDTLLYEIKKTLALIGVGLALGALLLSVFLYQKINPPLQDIIDGANRFAQGKFNSKLIEYDVREIDDLGSAMNRMATQLEHLETIRRDFVANVSHELKTPITSIKGFLETLEGGAKDDREDLDRFLGILSKQSGRLEAIVADLLTLSRLESEPVGELLSIHTEQVSGVLTNVRELCNARAAENNIQIVLDCSPDLELQLDHSLTTQALTNLTDNAIKFSGPGTTVTLTARTLDGYVRIDVADEGSGIPPEHIPRLFERFYRVDTARSRALGGTGLGLSIVKHIVVLHDGRISVDCPRNGGSVFHVDLPI